MSILINKQMKVGQKKKEAKQNKKQSKQSKKKQLLQVFHQTVGFLQIFTPEQMSYLEDKIHIFVFTRGQCLAKQKEYIDYLGVIAEGRAVAKGIAYEIGDVVGHTRILGYEQIHSKTVTAESDGVMVALRIIDFLSIEKAELKNRIADRLIEIYANKLMKREQIGLYDQFDTVQEKKINKYLTPQWTSFISNEMDSKQKSKFFTYFPFYRIKQKDIIANKTLKPSLIYVIQGQLIAKTKQQHRIIENGSMHNVEGFVFNQGCVQNVYCLSSEATIIVIDKQILEKSFKFDTFRGLMRLMLNDLAVTYKKPSDLAEEIEGKETKSWSIFKKYPNAEILPLPKRNESIKATKQVNNLSQMTNLANFQTLFRQQLGSNAKEKTSRSLAQSGYQKLYTLKTQSAGKETQAILQLQKLQKQVGLLTQKLKFSQQASKWSKLQLIQNQSRVSLGSVLKQIRTLYQEGDIIHVNRQRRQDVQPGQSFVTLKQALDKQLKDNKIQMLVAKCAFKWLYLTRKRKGGNLYQN